MYAIFNTFINITPNQNYLSITIIISLVLSARCNDLFSFFERHLPKKDFLVVAPPNLHSCNEAWYALYNPHHQNNRFIRLLIVSTIGAMTGCTVYTKLDRYSLLLQLSMLTTL